MPVSPPLPHNVASKAQQLRLLPPSELPSLFASWIRFDDCRGGLYSPLRTFWLFLWQALSPGERSLKDAVAEGATWVAANHDELPSGSSSGYSQARKRLELGLIRETLSRTSRLHESRLGPEHLWHGLRPKVVDGSSMAMPDTSTNRARWPAPSTTKPGCGFPTMRVVAVFCLFTGALLELATGPLTTHERTLWRSLWPTLRRGDLVLGDRGFGSFAEFWLLVGQGVDMVVRLNARRGATTTIHKKLGEGDFLVWWAKGNRSTCPDWMDLEIWESMPELLLVREITYSVAIPGFRTSQVTIATTLLDEKLYPAADFPELYRLRWQAELYIRDLKTQMGMEMLGCRSPEMIEKEVLMCWIAYNLVRGLMLEASLKYACEPTELSFKGAMRFIRAFSVQLVMTDDEKQREHLHECLLYYIAHELVRTRRGRSEPRVVKKRPKQYQKMTAPRKEMVEIRHRNRYTKARAEEEKQKAEPQATETPHPISATKAPVKK